MKRLLNRMAAFIRRDFQIATSYKLQFMFQLLGGFFITATFYFISKLIGSETTQTVLNQYQTDYFSFVLIGVASTGFLVTGLTGFAEKLRVAMTEGSLEMMFASPTRPGSILIMPCLWSFCFEIARAIAVVLFGVFIFGAHLDQWNLPACALVLLLTLTSYSVFGLTSAGIIMIVKRGDPISWVFAHGSALVAGAYFPIEILPGWLAFIAKLLPMTYAYHGMRTALLSGGGWADIKMDLLVLSVFSLIGVPLAVYVCALAVAKAKRDGSLGSF